MENVAVVDDVVEKESPQGEAVSEADTTVFEDEATSIDLALKREMQDRTYAFIRCCLNLKSIKYKRYYKTHAESWEEYVAGVGLTKTKANRMVKLALIIEAFITQTERVPFFNSIDEERLIKDWMPLVKYDKDTNLIDNVNESLELLEQAKTLSYSDFQIVIDQHKQTEEHPEADLPLEEGPVLDEHNNVIGNYRNTKATGEVHYFKLGILDRYIKGYEGQELKVNLGKVKGGEEDKEGCEGCEEV